MSSNAFNVFNETPGPGAYEPQKYRTTSNIKYTMARKYEEPAWNRNPGPG